MMSWLKIPALLFALLASSATAASAEDRKPSDIRIVFVTHGEASDTYWSAVKNGVLDGQAAMGSQVEYLAPDVWDLVRMGKMLDTAIASQPDGLVVTIPDLDAIGPKVKKAVAAGIPVIIIDTGEDNVEDLGARFYIGPSSYYDIGVKAARQLKAEGGKRGVCVNHEVGNAGNDTSCRGFIEEMGGNADVLGVSVDPTDIQARVEAYFAAHPETDAIYALGPVSAVPTIKALKHARLAGKVKFGTLNLSPEILQALVDGEMSFAIDFQQYLLGYLPVVFLTTNSLYGTMPSSNVYTGPAFVTAKDAPQIIELSKRGIR